MTPNEIQMLKNKIAIIFNKKPIIEEDDIIYLNNLKRDALISIIINYLKKQGKYLVNIAKYDKTKLIEIIKKYNMVNYYISPPDTDEEEAKPLTRNEEMKKLLEFKKKLDGTFKIDADYDSDEEFMKRDKIAGQKQEEWKRRLIRMDLFIENIEKKGATDIKHNYGDYTVSYNLNNEFKTSIIY